MVLQKSRWDDIGVDIPPAEAVYVVDGQPVAEYDNKFNYNVAEEDIKALFAFMNSYDANTILKADVDDTPIALPVGTQRVVGRLGGNIEALPIGIDDNDMVQIDGTPLTSEYARFTANGLEGRTYAELRSDVGVIFEESGNVIMENAAGGYDNSFVIGSASLYGAGTKMFFDKSKGAFRAGRADGNEWDIGNIGTYSFTGGCFTKAAGSLGSCAFGYGSIASGSTSFAEGYNTTAAGTFSRSEGRHSKANLYAQHAKASGMFSSLGDAQLSNLVARNDTDNTVTPTELFLDGATIRAILPASRTWAFTINIAARQTVASGAGTVGDSGIYKLEGGIKRDGANSTVLVGSVTKTVLAEDTAGWDVTAEADNTNEALVVKVTGALSMKIHWTAAINLVEVG